MRICIVSHYTQPHIGGVKTYYLRTCRLLANQGHWVAIVSTRTRDEQQLEFAHGVKIRHARAINVLERHLGIGYPIVGRQFCKFISEELAEASTRALSMVLGS